LFERLGSALIRQLPSDDERYDASFPDHPLSQVRARLAEVVATAGLDSGAGRLTPFPSPAGLAILEVVQAEPGTAEDRPAGVSPDPMSPQFRLCPG
jgi:hypothetical protein